MTYARARVFSGIFSIGWWVALCMLALLFDFSGYIAAYEGAHRPGAILAVFVLGYTLLGFPLDLWGGYILPRKHKRLDQSIIQWFAKWCRGVIVHGAIIWLSGMTILYAAQISGTVGAIATVGLLMLVLVRLQMWLGRIISPIRLQDLAVIGDSDTGSFTHMRYAIVDSEDDSFTGGVVGRPGKEIIVLPAKWKASLNPEMVEAITARRLGAILSGSRNRGLVIAILWNLLCFSLGTWLSPHAMSTAAGVIDVALIFSLFSFIGLFGILPFFSRKGTLEVDAWAKENGLCEFELQKLFSFHNTQEGDSPCRPKFIEFFCHSVPSVENRIQHLFMDTAPKGAWHAARQSLYFSWAGMGLLSRFAHCNLGRPDLWVMLPCE